MVFQYKNLCVAGSFTIDDAGNTESTAVLLLPTPTTD
jgi:hypothetical protein